MVDTEATVLSAHPHNFVNHVEVRLWNLGTCILFANHFPHVLVLAVFDLEQSFVWDSSKLLGSFLLYGFGDNFVCFHPPIVVFSNDVVALGKLGTLWSIGSHDRSACLVRGLVPDVGWV